MSDEAPTLLWEDETERDHWIDNQPCDPQDWQGPKLVVVTAAFDPRIRIQIHWYGRWVVNFEGKQIANSQRRNGVYALEEVELIVEAMAGYERLR